ncbi:MFS transporter, UMF1 family [Tistlia consotensis]|uniref:MFS transporter, UMF1 family n=1 Tax=Tistlia consotensis USBA 355 TaxID=560819 RepID=A0A1Y6BG94_9PROT|nr:MFS transporter [Tistlia consotensis]SMF09781.1 MFS transporter, UMF1 family [Tistlia consotensis USBA 355]SNR34259.1 MFS transporter, UMF1 family [Tistlia consotensis]
MQRRDEQGAGRGGRTAILAWCFYDWANSAFPTVIVTFVFAAYYTRALAPDAETGTGQWGLAMSLSGVAIAILAPILGAVADQGGRRKPWIAVFSLLCIASGAALWFAAPDPAWAVYALTLSALANLAFEIGTVFYNAMLPEVAPPRLWGRISGWAWGLGYAGGLACLVLTLVLFVQPAHPLFGLDRAQAEQVRIAGPFVALWFLVFALPMFLLTPDRAATGKPAGRAVAEGLSTLRRSLARLPKQRRVLRYLIARMLYTDGLNTLFAFGGIYAAGTFGMDFTEILVFGILLNVTAGLGAFGFAWIDDWIGPKRTVLIAVGALMLLGAAILLIDSKLWFYVLGCAIGVFIGPAQSASRTLMARLAPAETRTEMFGLYALSGKVTAFIGPAAVGGVTVLMDSQRWGMATILLLFAVGFALLLPLEEPPAEAEPGPAAAA